MNPQPGTGRRRRGLFYGWKLVALAAVVHALASGPVWSGMEVWLRSLELHFGWTRTQLTGAFALAQMEGTIVGPMTGYLVDRMGPRIMVFAGFLIIGLGFVTFSLTTNLTVFYLAFVILMLGVSTGTFLPMMAVVNRWLSRLRGSAVALAGERNFLGGLALVPVLAWAVNPDHFGWQVTARWIGVVFLVSALPIALLVRNRPEDYGEYPDGDLLPPITSQLATPRGTRRRAPADSVAGFTARQAVRTRVFWLITIAHGFTSMINQTILVHLVPLLTDQSLSLLMAAYVSATIMGVGSVFQLVGGYAGDRLPKNVAYALFAAIQTAGFLLIVAVRNTPMAFLAAVIYGAGHSGRTPISVAIRAEYFGQRAFGTITGVSLAPMHILQLFAPLFAAAMFDRRGSYTEAFLILAVFGFASPIMFLLARRPTFPSTAPGATSAGDTI